jgi:hypothetical protein
MTSHTSLAIAAAGCGPAGAAAARGPASIGGACR